MKSPRKRTPSKGILAPQLAPESLPCAGGATTNLVLILHANELAAWQVTPEIKPKALPIKEDLRLAVRDVRALESAYADVTQRLRGDGVKVGYTHWLADAGGREWCATYASTVRSTSPWQLLAWEWVADRFGLGDASPWEAPGTFTNEVIPWLVTAQGAAQPHYLYGHDDNRHLDESERLIAERAALAQENERLRTQNAALQQVDTERLVSFLPALFYRVFTVLGTGDLALLCGRLEPLSIANPYEPSEETLRTLQKRFRTLTLEQQRQIVRFVSNLPHRQRLQVRSEMRELVHELEEF